MSVCFTSPGCCSPCAPTGDDRGRGGWPRAAVAVLIPTLLYYGGGWLQYGYRYFLDSVPFVMALCLAAAAQGRDRLGLEGPDRVRRSR